MKLKCPECFEKLDSDYKCLNKHQYSMEDGVLILLNSNFKHMLNNWLNNFHQFQKKDFPISFFDNLPASGIQFNANIWKARKNDLTIITSQLFNGRQKILDLGSWNGWLANSLSKQGNEVTAIDYFIHEYNGLKAKNNYSNPVWFAIQMDLENLNVLDEKFDLIVVNRCISYFTDVNKQIKSIINMLAPNGKIIITGINVSTSNLEAKELTVAKKTFKNQFGENLFFKETKAFTSYDDLNDLKQSGFSVHRYPNFKNLVKHLIRKDLNVVHYAIFKNHE